MSNKYKCSFLSLLSVVIQHFTTIYPPSAEGWKWSSSGLSNTRCRRWLQSSPSEFITQDLLPATCTSEWQAEPCQTNRERRREWLGMSWCRSFYDSKPGRDNRRHSRRRPRLPGPGFSSGIVPAGQPHSRAWPRLPHQEEFCPTLTLPLFILRALPISPASWQVLLPLRARFSCIWLPGRWSALTVLLLEPTVQQEQDSQTHKSHVGSRSVLLSLPATPTSRKTTPPSRGREQVSKWI